MKGSILCVIVWGLCLILGIIPMASLVPSFFGILLLVFFANKVGFIR